MFVGMGRVTVFIRNARSLKDKRQVFKSIRQKLVNRGFSVVECGTVDNPKAGTLGFSYAGKKESEVSNHFQEAKTLFFGDFEVTGERTEIVNFDFIGEEAFDFDKYGDEEEGTG